MIAMTNDEPTDDGNWFEDFAIGQRMKHFR